MRYRADIDGLRAIAVVPVVLFHTGFSGFGGGFVGVDIFFVISGYLIAHIIKDEIENGRFSVFAFYDRRIRRILPALFAMVAFCVVMAVIFFLPSDFQLFSKSLIAVALFSSNIEFWHEAGYFDAAADVKPLLHTWSLAVEEQFYIVFPLFVMAVYRWVPQRWPVALTVAAVASFVFSVWGAVYHADSTFYLLPGRAWELLCGAMISLAPLRPLQQAAFREGIGFAALGLMLYPVLAYTENTIFPGFNALAPCLGAALVIYAGRGDLNLIGRLLSSTPLVFVGRISYSLYLWHWPIIVFYRYIHITPLSQVDKIVILPLSVSAAIVSYFFVEKPFRRAPSAAMRPRVFASGATAIAICMAIGIFGSVARGWPDRFPQAIVDIVGAQFAVNPRTNECLGGTLGNFNEQHPDFKCVIGAAVPPRIALWGDSHGNALVPGFGEEAAAHGQSAVFFGHRGCIPLVDLRRADDMRLPCARYAKEILQLIESSPGISTVIIAARWPGSIYGPSIALGPAENGQRLAVIAETSREPPKTTEGIERLFGDKLDETVARLRAMGKQVVLVESIPEVGYDVPSTLARLTMLKRDTDIIEPSVQSFLDRNRGITPRIEKIAGKYALEVIRPKDALCDQSRCRVIVDGKPAYADDDHLSIDGSRVVAKLFEPIFASIAAQKYHSALHE